MSRVRTFIAIELPKLVRERLIALQDQLSRDLAGVKWVGPDNLHVTLLFLGEVDNRELPALCRAVDGVTSTMPPLLITIESVGCFPNPRRPRVIWVGVGTGADEIIALHDALEQPLLALGCYRREERKYTPHVTLGRLKGESAPSGLAGVLTKHQTWQAGDATVNEVHVMSSELMPQGPTYAVLSRARFRG